MTKKKNPAQLPADQQVIANKLLILSGHEKLISNFQQFWNEDLLQDMIALREETIKEIWDKHSTLLRLLFNSGAVFCNWRNNETNELKTFDVTCMWYDFDCGNLQIELGEIIGEETI